MFDITQVLRSRLCSKNSREKMKENEKKEKKLTITGKLRYDKEVVFSLFFT